MTFTVINAKTVTIPDWTQIQLNQAIGNGQFPSGTLLANIALASDWNTPKSISGELPITNGGHGANNSNDGIKNIILGATDLGIVSDVSLLWLPVYDAENIAGGTTTFDALLQAFLNNSAFGQFILSSGISINAKNTGTTSLYTVPIGKTAIITSAIVRCTAATAITVGPTLGIGVSAGEDDMFPSTAITALTTTAKIFGFQTIGMSVSATAGSIIKVGIDTGSTGTAQTIAIELIGYLV